jgi:hypothetical protein
LRKQLLAGLVVGALAVALAPVASSQVPPTPPRKRWFAENDTGHWSDGTRVRIDKSCRDVPRARQVGCSLAAFRKKPFVVVAFVDSGINPYHRDFRAPEFKHHPSKYIQSFPKNAKALDLSLGLADRKGYAPARKKDEKKWSVVQSNKLYWIPGTRIVGGYSTDAGGTNPDNPWVERPILDENGHGSGVASVSAGRVFGSNPNALIVMVEGLGEASLEWATSQRWIDVVSNSWGNRANLPLGDPGSTRRATRRGQSVLFSAGNGATNTNSSTAFPEDGPVEDPCKCKTPDSDISATDPWSGPSWQITVGAASPINGQAHWWHSVPVDVSSFGSKWRAAGAWGVKTKIDKANEQTRDFGGTSCAAPTTAGVLSSVILKARELLNDRTGGQRRGQAVAVAGRDARRFNKGPLADGKLIRLEAEAMVLKTAFPVDADPEKISWDYAVRPTTDAYYTYQGYGVVYRKSKALAMKVLVGKKALPDRPEVDAWIERVDAARDAMWGPP